MLCYKTNKTLPDVLLRENNTLWSGISASQCFFPVTACCIMFYFLLIKHSERCKHVDWAHSVSHDNTLNAQIKTLLCCLPFGQHLHSAITTVQVCSESPWALPISLGFNSYLVEPNPQNDIEGILVRWSLMNFPSIPYSHPAVLSGETSETSLHTLLTL